LKSCSEYLFAAQGGSPAIQAATAYPFEGAQSAPVPPRSPAGLTAALLLIEQQPTTIRRRAHGGYPAQSTSSLPIGANRGSPANRAATAHRFKARACRLRCSEYLFAAHSGSPASEQQPPTASKARACRLSILLLRLPLRSPQRANEQQPPIVRRREHFSSPAQSTSSLPRVAHRGSPAYRAATAHRFKARAHVGFPAQNTSSLPNVAHRGSPANRAATAYRLKASACRISCSEYLFAVQRGSPANRAATAYRRAHGGSPAQSTPSLPSGVLLLIEQHPPPVSRRAHVGLPLRISLRCPAGLTAALLLTEQQPPTFEGERMPDNLLRLPLRSPAGPRRLSC
jgi:hypothetical protein